MLLKPLALYFTVNYQTAKAQHAIFIIIVFYLFLLTLLNLTALGQLQWPYMGKVVGHFKVGAACPPGIVQLLCHQ